MTQALCWWLAATPAGAEHLELREVLRAAERHPLLDVSQADKAGAAGVELSARGSFDTTVKALGGLRPVSGYEQQRLDVTVTQPTPLWGLDLFAGYKLGLGSYPSYDGRITNQFGEVRVGAELPLLRNGWADRRRTGLTRAEAGSTAATAALAQQRLEVARIAAHRYWEWVGAGRRREVARSLLSIARDRDAQLAERVRAGDLPSFERDDNRRALLQREALMAQAQRALEQAAIELSLFLRDEALQPVAVREEWLPNFEELDEGAFEVDLEALLQRRPDLEGLRAQLAQARAEVQLARNQLLPGLDLGLVFRKDFGPGDSKLDKPELELTAALDWPVLNRTQRGRLSTAEAAARKLESQLRLAGDRVAAEVRDVQSAINAARVRLKAVRAELAAARSLEAQERQRFALGDSTLLFVNLREQQSAEAASREIDTLVDAWRAVATWRAVTVADDG